MSTRRHHLAALGGLGALGLGAAAAGAAAALPALAPASRQAVPTIAPPDPSLDASLDPSLDPSGDPSVDPSAGPGPSPDPSPQPPDPPPDGWALTARRTELTLPDLPTLGLSYLCLLDLFDESGTEVGTAAADARVIGVALEGPVVLATVVLQLADGEVHYQRIMDRFGAYPRTATGAILGGTGAYHDIRGEVDISWPDPDRIDLLIHG